MDPDDKLDGLPEEKISDKQNGLAFLRERKLTLSADVPLLLNSLSRLKNIELHINNWTFKLFQG